MKKFSFHWILSGLLAIVFALEIISLFTSWKPGWLDAALIVLVVASSIAALSRHLPPQNVLFASFIIALAGGAVSIAGEKFGVPFGRFYTGVNSEPRIFGTISWAMPLIWIAAILNSRGVARLILRPWRKTRTYGFKLIGLTALLTAGFDFAFEPFAAWVKHFWFWAPMQFPISWEGVPLENFFSWWVVTLLILAFITPILINKQLSKRPPADLHPLVIWLGALTLFAVGSATEKLWGAVAVDAAIGIVAAIFAIRGMRW